MVSHVISKRIGIPSRENKMFYKKYDVTILHSSGKIEGMIRIEIVMLSHFVCMYTEPCQTFMITKNG